MNLPFRSWAPKKPVDGACYLRGFAYPILQGSGSKNHTLNRFWNKQLQLTGLWTLSVQSVEHRSVTSAASLLDRVGDGASKRSALGSKVRPGLFFMATLQYERV